MASRTRSRGTRGSGPTRRDASSWPTVAAASAVASGCSTASPNVSNPASDPRTNATYRMLTIRGLTPPEAANLTAYLCGLAIADQPWSIGEVNRLLFLRELDRTGRFGPDDGATPTD